MKLRVRFLQLPILFDADRLAQEVNALPADAWRAHPQGYPGNDALPLIIVTARDGLDDRLYGLDGGADDYLRKPVMRHEVLAWAWAEAQVTLMRAWMDADSISTAMTELTTTEETEADEGRGTVRRVSASRKVSSLMSELHKAEVRAANRRKELGLTPLARARLGKDIASSQFDLARYFAELDAAEKDAPKETA